MNIFMLLLYLVSVITIVIIISNTNTPSKAITYVFLVVAFPVIGIIIYYTLGVNHRKEKIYQKKIDLDKNAFPKLKKELLGYTLKTLAEYKSHFAYFLPLAMYMHKKNALTSNNKVELLINGENKFPEVIESLKRAKHHIHLQYYIYKSDGIGSEIGEILIGKAKEGVEVRFIYDDFGSKKLKKSFITKLKKAGVEVFPFYKIIWVYLASRINYRNHRKIIVVDGKISYVGGINIADNYINTKKNTLFWRDTHLKINGLATLNLQYIFLTDWNYCAKQNIKFSEAYFPFKSLSQVDDEQLVQIISSGPDSDLPNVLYTMIQAISLSRKEILLTTPYFIPDKSFIDALKIAKMSGVTIKILVPGISDSILVNAVASSYYLELLELGIEIYKYNKGFVHSKTMICDDLVSFIGTANVDHRSFELNFEVNAIIYDKKMDNKLKLQFEEDLLESERIDLNLWKKRPKYVFIFERFMRLFSPLM